MKDKLNKICSNSDDLYNDKFVGAKGLTNEKVRCNAMDQGSYPLFFVSQDFSNKHYGIDDGGAECSNKFSKFPVTVEQKKNYDVVCSLASSRHSK